MIINIPKDGKSRPVADPEDAPLAVDGPTEEAGDPGGDLGRVPDAPPEIPQPADATRPPGIQLRTTPDTGGTSLVAKRSMEHDRWTRRLLGMAEYELRRALGPSATLRGVASELAEANRWRGSGQWVKELLDTHEGIAGSVREFAGLQLPNFSELELMKSAATAVAEAAGVRDGLMKTFQDVHICLGQYNRVMPSPFLGVGAGFSIQRQRSFIESRFCGGDHGIQWAAREAEELRHLLGGLQGHAEWSLVRDSLEMMRGLPRDFDPALMRRLQDGLIRGRWVGPARNLGDFLPAPSARPEPGADRLAEDQPAPCAEAPASAIVAPGSTNLDRAVFLEIAQQCDWSLDRLLRVLAEMRGARVEMPRPAPERAEPRAPTKSRRSRSGGVRGGVVIRDQGGVFEVGFGRSAKVFSKLKGLTILKILTDRPDNFFSCLDLRAAVAEGSIARSVVGENEAAARQYGLREGYAHLAELEEEMREAEVHNDWDRKADAESQHDELVRKLHEAVGGRPCHKEVSAELANARKAVSAAISYAYRVIRPEMPDLEQHLRGRVTTGYHCRYMKLGEKN